MSKRKETAPKKERFVIKDEDTGTVLDERPLRIYATVIAQSMAEKADAPCSLIIEHHHAYGDPTIPLRVRRDEDGIVNTYTLIEED